MRKYIFYSIIILFIYYIFTFLISFTILTKAVVDNDPIALQKYINIKELRNNLYNDIYEFGSNLINSMDKEIKITSESTELTGELTPIFLEKLFSKIANNISIDFSNPEIILYFYLNSNELSTYLIQSFTKFGNYNFQKYLLEHQLENIENNEDKKEAENNNEEVKEEVKEEEENIISKFIKRIRSTNYFFLTSPIHFKIDVKHQDILFVLILKFNGYAWKVQKIKIPYKKLIDSKNISLSN